MLDSRLLDVPRAGTFAFRLFYSSSDKRDLCFKLIILYTALCVSFHTWRSVLCVYYEYLKTFVT